VAASPAPILGHIFLRENPMAVEIPYAAVLLAAFEAGCIAVGALLGIGVVLVRMWGERRAN
jgi:hypothetical protein